MLRYLLVAIVGFGLVAGGLFMPWGDKHVERAECSAVFDSREGRALQACRVQSVDALYWADHLTADLRAWETADGEQSTSVGWVREFHDYEMSGDKLDGNGGLFWGRPILWFGLGVAAAGALALGATWKRRSTSRWTSLYLLLGGASILGLGATLGLGGMVVHAGTWSGTSVSRLAPRIGGIALLAGTSLGVFGTVRFTRNETLRLRGLLGASPLAPIHDWTRAEEATVDARAKAKLVWGRPSMWTLAATALVGLALIGPLAHKDVGLFDCAQSETRGFVCTPIDYEVDYHALNVQVRHTIEGEATVYETWNYGFLRQHFGGPPHMPFAAAFFGAGAAVLLVGVRAMLVRQPAARAGATHWRALAACAVLMATGLSGIVLQSFQWAGSPAGHLRPGWGLFAALAGGALWLVAARSVRRTLAPAEDAVPAPQDPSP